MSVDLGVEAGEAPAGTEADAVVWDDAGFIRRVNQEADKLGVSLNEVCRRAGLSKDYLGKTPQGGRNVLSIQKLAAVLGVEPAYLMGFATEVHIKPNPPTREETQLQALGLAANIAGPRLSRAELPADAKAAGWDRQEPARRSDYATAVAADPAPLKGVIGSLAAYSGSST
jgi:transcriptional regulator with XRE-family HTH domain